MTAATPEPWRAAWMAFRDAAGFDTAADRAPDDELDAQWIAAWTAAAQAAIAAQEPQPAPGELERALAVLAAERNQYHIALVRILRDASRDHCTCSVVARTAERTLGQHPEPQPAPELAALRLAAVRSILADDSIGAEDARSRALAAAYDDSPPWRQPQAAPELAAAMAEPRELRKVITELLGMFRAVSGGWGARTSSSRLRKIAARAGVRWDEFPAARTVLGGTGDTTYRVELAKLREALEATLTDWREDAVYRVTDTRDEMNEHCGVTACADTLAGILADHQTPGAQPGQQETNQEGTK